MNPNEPAREVTLQLLLQAQSSTTKAVEALASSTRIAQLNASGSTTEAIYTVGYNAQIYGGIILLLIFGYMGFTFTKRYI